jgi:hypothetical protein
MKAAVIGAGIFGCTAAIELARNGLEVDLFDRHGRILQGASRANCFRLHHGYHYPRDPQPDLARDAARFAARFPDAIDRSARHYYCVAKNNSHVTGEEFLAFCDGLGLPYEQATPLQVLGSAVDACVRVPEATVNVKALRATLYRELAGVEFYPDTTIQPDQLTDYDWVIQSTYGRSTSKVLRWEVCETALVRLGRQFAGRSFVILDGPFACLDPEPDTTEHVLYDVANSVHSANVGTAPHIPAHLAPLVDRGRVFTAHTRVEAMLQTLRRFLGGVGIPEYCGSRFTVRAVLPDVEATDARPTLVERRGRVVSILSGKIATAVTAAEQVAGLVREAVSVA